MSNYRVRALQLEEPLPCPSPIVLHANANSRCAKTTEPYQRNRVIIERAYAWL